LHWCRFIYAGTASFGRIDGDRIRRVEGCPFDAHRVTGDSVPLVSARLLPPVLPFTFFCVGLNYRGHILHAQAKGLAVAKFPERPEVGYRANNALIGHGEAIVVPADFRGQLEAEGELVAVIGRRTRRASRAEAEAAIFGWTVGNDVSAREWQRGDRTLWRAKNSDTFKPMGPCIVEGADPATATTRVRVNGAQVCEFATGGMIFDAVDYIVEISRYITLHPGDVLWMGADGTAPIVAGDVVEVEISGIGTLANPVVADPLSAPPQ
jgi:2-keto-4-pentenoate hydratase/2-oxohepta-3-ene-1,7-dioic acid hydratase in catechol pathway